MIPQAIGETHNHPLRWILLCHPSAELTANSTVAAAFAVTHAVPLDGKAARDRIRSDLSFYSLFREVHDA